jgi:hypothetical protein
MKNDPFKNISGNGANFGPAFMGCKNGLKGFFDVKLLISPEQKIKAAQDKNIIEANSPPQFII